MLVTEGEQIYKAGTSNFSSVLFFSDLASILSKTNLKLLYPLFATLCHHHSLFLN